MSSHLRCVPGPASSLKALKTAVSLLALAAVSGCSADVTRFDSHIFGYDGKPTSALRPSEGMLGGNSQRLADEPPPAAGGGYGGYGAMPDYAPGYRPASERRSAIDGGFATARLDPPREREPYQLASDRNRFAQTSQQRDARNDAPAAPVASASGEIIVQPGDTLYGLSRKHGVSVAALSSANGLTGNIIRPGQRLVLPGATTPPAVAQRAPQLATRVATPISRPLPPEVQAEPRSSAPEPLAGDTYVLKPGDSLFAISRRTRVSVAELTRLNGITDPRRLRPGMTLRLRGEAAAAPAAVAQAPDARRDARHDMPSSRSVRTQPVVLPPRTAAPVAQQTEPEAPALQGVTSRPTILNDSRRRVASLDQPEVKTDAQRVAPVAPTMEQPKRQAVAVATPERVEASVSEQASGFRWPVRGKVVSGFGKRADGTHNDGINIAVPPGTDVHAVESGVVAYAGSELKGYGHLVLIRHDNGWVSAYAHNDSILVKRGDKVERGQVISKSGRSGSVDQPQLHFELRQGSKPVDPLLHLAKG